MQKKQAPYALYRVDKPGAKPVPLGKFWKPDLAESIAANEARKYAKRGGDLLARFVIIKTTEIDFQTFTNEVVHSTTPLAESESCDPDFLEAHKGLWEVQNKVEQGKQ